jgi:hypothetical protein
VLSASITDIKIAWYENLTPAIPSAEVELYGCGINPAGSISVVSGSPSAGSAMVIGIDNPVGTQAAGSLALLALSASPDSNFPCGTALPGFGMLAPYTGELLIHYVPFLILSGPAWDGVTPVPITIDFPNTSSVVGLELYVQGALLDATPGALHLVGLTDALRLKIGS